MRDATRSAAGQDSVPELLEHTLVQGMRDTGANVGAVYLRSPDERALRLAMLSGVPWEIALPWARVGLEAPTPVADALRDRRLVWLGGQEEMARRYPQLALVLPYPFALAAAPVTTGDTDWGGLVLHWPGPHPGELSPGVRDAIGGVCHRVGLLLRMAADSGHPVVPGATPRMVSPPEARDAVAPAVGRAAEASGAAAATARFAERLPGGCCALDPDGRMTFVSATAARLLGAGVSELLGARPWEVLPWLSAPVAQDNYRASMISRRPTSFTALRPPARWLAFRLYPDATGISVRIASVPAADAPDPAQAPPPTPASATTRTAALYHLTHLAATLTEAVGVRDVADRVADQVLPATGAQALALMTAEEGRLRTVGHRGGHGELHDRLDGSPLSSTAPAAHCLTTGTPSFFASSSELREAHPSARLQDDMAAWCFLPLIVSGRPVGSLVLGYDLPHPFDPSERTVLTSLAGLIAQALDRARLYDANHRLAHSLQAGLLPRALPRMSGLDVAARYLPAGHGMGIGGDFYDLIRLDDTTAAAAIGDVQGHSVQAATLMGQVRTAVHATAGAPPSEVLARTNRLLTDLDPGLFTSCLYAHLDLARHRAHLASAGHPPPVLRHPGGRTEVLRLPPGLLLGIDPAATYSATGIALAPGAVLVLYTDGLVEVPGVDLDVATDALADRLAGAGGADAEALAEVLVDDVRRRAHRSDDVALLVVRAR
ncbi:PAS/PAC sensor protein [Streptomyces toyocaensis]|uniref:protein-serine/threonine phosphatase n=1 Tax=Streptomyces toyocaensis TaxID=55952 RepID=A0A081XHX0_STRTO|nr:SpoIIE family protein phosphatase [Streptomyces toyocaensis]KES03143.1 PAS/PAC sensor protein [Streptomyces toyocaensis]